jgi:multiple sugar transport system ATP-binding protein
MATISFDGVGKTYEDGTIAVADLDLDIADGEFFVLVGPSGSGKSTALRLLAGLEETTAGHIRIGGEDVTDLEPRDRDLAMVFQSYALYPHKTVADNLGFALRMRKVPKEEIAERVQRAAERLGIVDQLHKRPRHLSGGQRQRVALGRAIVREPQAFLMDEPLSNLDAKLRVEMRAYLARLHQELGTTTVYVTHDQTEAMTLGDRIAVLRAGRLVQVDTPQALYDRPADAFVAAFIGSPAMNLVRARLEEVGGELRLAIGDQWVALPPGDATEVLRPRAGGEIVVGLRPETLEIANGASADQGSVIELGVALTEALGSDLLVHLDVDAAPVLTGDQLDVARQLGDTGTMGRLTARLAPHTKARVGDRVRVRVDATRLHLFDGETLRRLAPEAPDLTGSGPVMDAYRPGA